MTPDSLVWPSPLESRGFAVYRRAAVLPGLSDDVVRSLLAPWSRYYDNLPLDPNDPTAHRYRRYARGLLQPTGRIAWESGIPDADYGAVADFVSGNLNPEYPGGRRRFPYADPAMLGDQLFNRLIQFDLDQAVWSADLGRAAITVGVHFVRLHVNERGRQAVSSPNCLHQDGGLHTNYFVHLLARQNATGGVNLIAPARCAGRDPEDVPKTDLLAEFTLDEALDGYGFHDVRISHYVSPIRQLDPAQPATRDALLIGLIAEPAPGFDTSRR